MKEDFALSLYKFGISVGFAALPSHFLNGLKNIVNPVDYWRFVEAPYVINNLYIENSDVVLDIGSPKIISLYVSCILGASMVYATDIMDYFIDRYGTYYNCYERGTKKNPGGEYILEVQDGRRLQYPDNHFDKVFSVSVLEHIPDDGDTKTMKEISRVLKKDGIVSITVPFAKEYRETYVHRDVYERKIKEEKDNFYQRHYDQNALIERLIKPSGLELVDLSYYRERYFHWENFMLKIPNGFNVLTLPLQLLFSKVFLHKCAEADIPKALMAGLTLRKKED